MLLLLLLTALGGGSVCNKGCRGVGGSSRGDVVVLSATSEGSSFVPLSEGGAVLLKLLLAQGVLISREVTFGVVRLGRRGTRAAGVTNAAGADFVDGFCSFSRGFVEGVSEFADAFLSDRLLSDDGVEGIIDLVVSDDALGAILLESFEGLVRVASGDFEIFGGIQELDGLLLKLVGERDGVGSVALELIVEDLQLR